ncbi:hypothetical protein C1J01_22490 [Nonomuraea aridisoli]|uniref:Uncharacterized protein n=1 Tax=Nonomuraea aridisoli TaxID=2070368 RepID=A0A2W2FLL7_9ACTN|nr:hypothetical protein C1J01_22490 [Nonomuraea aridisoli]
MRAGRRRRRAHRRARAAEPGHRARCRAAALLVRDLPALPPGVRHIEQLVDPVAFLSELAADEFDLRLDDHERGTRR